MTANNKQKLSGRGRTHEEAKNLVRFKKEKEKEYYNMGIPALWRDINNIKGQIIPGKLFYSQISKGCFLWVTSDVLKRRLELEEIPLNVQEDVKKLIGEETSEVLSHAAVDLLRLELFASLTHGYERIKLECGSNEEIEAAVRIIGGIKDESEGMIGKPILSTSQDPRKLTYTIDVEKEIGTEVFAYDFHELTKQILNLTEELISNVERCIEENVDKRFRSLATTYERLLDFLWAYGCRQLVKGINRGFFCGNEYSGVHAIGLGGFYKLLEHTVDDLIRVVQVLHLFKLKFREGLKVIDDLTKELATDLRAIKDEIEEIDDVLLNSMIRPLQNEDYRKIGKMIKNYNTKWKVKFGAMAESYLESRKDKKVKEYEKDYFGEFGYFWFDSIDGKLFTAIRDYQKTEDVSRFITYQFLLSQLMLPLQRIARFPRIIAIFARFMATKSKLSSKIRKSTR